MLEIQALIPESPAAELELAQGDQILQLNDRPAEDFLDLILAERDGLQRLEILHNKTDIWEVELDLEPGQPLGVICEQPVPLECGNQCLFCFVHQLPKGMRRSLYLKDEDYRFSFLYGSYVTLSNVDSKAFDRIIDRQLSPLYISVHAVDEQVREHLLGAAQKPLLPQLKRLTDAEIQLHTQVVVCPGINDGAVLRETINTLEALSPHILSLAVVAVGLTGHRRYLPKLKPFDAAGASEVIDLVEQSQQGFWSKRGSRFVWPVDEFYQIAGCPVPSLANYEDLYQIENGVGMLALFAEEVDEVLAEAVPLPEAQFTLVTGESAVAPLKNFTQALAGKTGLDLHVVAVQNRFFGGETSVAGLITGSDVLSQLHSRDSVGHLLVPDVMLRQGEEVFLDDMTVSDLSLKLGVPVDVIPGSSPWGLWETLERLTGQSVQIIRE